MHAIMENVLGMCETNMKIQHQNSKYILWIEVLISMCGMGKMVKSQASDICLIPDFKKFGIGNWKCHYFTLFFPFLLLMLKIRFLQQKNDFINYFLSIFNS